MAIPSPVPSFHPRSIEEGCPEIRGMHTLNPSTAVERSCIPQDNRKQPKLWETPTGRTGRRSRQQLQPKIASILKSLRECEDLATSMNPWIGKLQPREEAIILSQQQDWRTALALFSWFRRQEGYVPNVFRYNIMFRILGRHERWDLLQKMWDDMLANCVRPTNVTFSTIIDTYSRAGLKDDALAWYESMHKQGLEPDEVTLNTVVNLYKRFGDFEQADRFSQTFLFGSSDSLTCATGGNDSTVIRRPQTVQTYNTLIHLYGKCGRISDATSVFDDMLSNGLQPDTVTFNTMVHICGCHNRLEEAEALLEKMEEAGCLPDLGTFNTVIAMHCKVGNIQAGKEYFLRLKEKQVNPDAVTYRTLLVAYCRKGLVTEAEGMLSEMKEGGIPLDGASCIHLTEMYIAAEEFEKASKMLGEIKFCPSLTSNHFSGVINAYAECGLWREAECAFCTARELGLGGDTALYNVMLKAYGVAGVHQKAFNLFESMNTDELAANQATYNTMIHVAVLSDQLEKATSLLKDMQKAGFQPNCSSFTAILTGYSRIGQVDKAKSIFQAMKQANVLLDDVAYGALINMFAEAKMVKETEDILHSLESAEYPVNHIVYTSVLRLYAKLDMIEEAEKTFKKILKLESGPDMLARNTILGLYSKARMLGAAHNLFKKMCADRQIDMVSCSIMMMLYKEEGKIHEALSVAQLTQEMGLLSDVSSFNNIIGLYASMNNQQDAAELFKQMVRSGVLPDLTTYHRLKDVLENPGLLKEVVEQLDIDQKSNDQDSKHSLIASASLYSMAGLPTQAMEACTKLKDGGFELDVAAYNALIYTFGSTGQFDEAVKLFMEMQSRGLRPNTVTFTTMLLFYGKAGLVEGVTRLFKRMKQAECEPDDATYKVVTSIYKEAGRLELAAMVTQEMQFARFLKERGRIASSDDESDMSN